jgi:hypothetical protein
VEGIHIEEHYIHTLTPAMDVGTPTLRASEAAIENASPRDGYTDPAARRNTWAMFNDFPRSI